MLHLWVVVRPAQTTISFAMVATAVLLASCDRSSQTTSPPSTAPAHVTSASSAAAATTQSVAAPVPAVIMINQQRYVFPPAIVQLRHRDQKLDAVLLSDDPKEAIKPNYHGNSFYIQIPAQATDVKDLSSAPWRYTAPSSERSDSPDGIFLDGNRLQLQPADMSVRIEGEGPALTVYLSGNFQIFDTHDERSEPKLVPVTATLTARIK
jgi:hypothetical protein